MRYTLLISTFLLMAFSSCKKNKFETTPSLEFKSVSTTELHTGNIIQFTLSFTDKEGDLTDSIYVEKVEPNCVNSNFHQLYPLPSFPATTHQKGEIVVTYGYNAGQGYQNIAPQCPPNNDVATFKFVLKDKKQNVSDTVSSPPITIYSN